MKLVAPLLKSYQEEVDRLTTRYAPPASTLHCPLQPATRCSTPPAHSPTPCRAKHGEGSFLEVYKKLYEAPDPAPVLATGLEFASRAAELEAQVSVLSSELDEYRAESKELKNQDLTIRRLEEKARGLEADLQDKDRALEEALKGAAADTERRLAEEAQRREDRLQVDLTAAQAELDAVRRAHAATQSQLFNVQERSGEEAAAARAAAERAEDEVERVQEWVGALEREKEALLAKMRGERDERVAATDATELAAVREEARVQRSLASKLQSELAGLQERAASDVTAAVAAADKARAALAAKEAHCAALEAELASRPTGAELEDARQQVRVLRALIHGSEDEDGGGGGAPEGGVGSVEAALLAKSRHLEHKLTMARLEVAEARGEAEGTAAKAAELEGEVERYQALIARLEEDLLAAEASAAAASGAKSAAGSNGTAALYEGGAAPTDADSDHSMVGVLSAQRDRFRARVVELETAVAGLNAQLTKARGEAEAARADNVALVERLKYVQGYSGGAGVGMGRKSVGDVETGEVVGKYMKEYESRIDPFSDFQAREREARRKGMPLQDRAAYALSSALSGNKTARTIILVYALLLHFGVFLLMAGYVLSLTGD